MRTIEEIAAELDRAAAARSAVAPLHETEPELDAAGAYAVQAAWARLRTGRGERLVGYKIGLAGEASRRQFGVDEPESGRLFDAMLVPAGGKIAAAELLQPMAEPEIAFHLARELRGPGVTEDDVRRATAGVCPALEIVDSRIRDWRIALVDTVADNASSARVVLGEAVPLGDRDLATAEGAVLRDGDVIAEGVGSSIFGRPLRAVAWLANHLPGTAPRPAEPGICGQEGSHSRCGRPHLPADGISRPCQERCGAPALSRSGAVSLRWRRIARSAFSGSPTSIAS